MIALCYMPVCMDVFFDFRHDFVLIFCRTNASWRRKAPMKSHPTDVCIGGGEADLLWSWKQNGLFCEQDGLFCEISFSFYKNTYFYFNILPLIVWFFEFLICVLRLRLNFYRLRIKKGSIVVPVAFCVSVSCRDDVFLCAWHAFGMKILICVVCFSDPVIFSFVFCIYRRMVGYLRPYFCSFRWILRIILRLRPCIWV